MLMTKKQLVLLVSISLLTGCLFWQQSDYLPLHKVVIPERIKQMGYTNSNLMDYYRKGDAEYFVFSSGMTEQGTVTLRYKKNGEVGLVLDIDAKRK